MKREKWTKKQKIDTGKKLLVTPYRSNKRKMKKT